MKIENRTHWRTDHLRAFVVLVADLELDSEKRRGYTVLFKYGRRGVVSGRAHIGGSSCRIMLPKLGVGKPGLAYVLAHEMAHSRGLNHKGMRGAARYTWKYGTLYDWALALPLDIKTASPKVSTEEKRASKMVNAEKMVGVWEKRVKRSNTWLKKWRRRLRAMELRQAATASTQSTTNQEG